ncbi:MAG: PBP1A family penicillin-binding protein [Firmicutes bacterium]|jgi:penicillin-binding protein 1A|nr:PBP1A family penicillin-binding protein [Candidatus Fermentithermobacillaceae bacterium]
MAKKRRRKKQGPRILDLIIYLLLAAVLIGACFAIVVVVSAYRDLPDLSNLEPTASATSILYDAQGEIWTELKSGEYRIPIPIEDMPSHLLDAVLAAEDHRFYSHPGFDLRAILRALYQNITDASGLQGGSTITQQLAKIAFLEPDRTLKRKVQDVMVATLLERKYTKTEILEMYVNQIPFGRGAYGVEAAARAYFNKSASELDIEESAFLAGIIRAPSYYGSKSNLEEGLNRRNTVLGQMAEYGFLSPDEAEEYKQRPLNIVDYSPMVVTEGGYFLDYVLEYLLSRYSSDMVYGGGLRVYTTYSPSAQKSVEAAIKDVLDPVFPYKEDEPNIECAAIVMDVRTGYLLAMVGGRKHESMLGWNRAIDAKRQPGSAFKPIAVYIPALEAGMGPYTVIDDSPVTWVDPVSKESFSPRNYSPTFQGLVTMRKAVVQSLNVVACKVQDMVGIQKSLETAEALGITTLVKTPIEGGRSDYTRSLALGGLTYGVTPLDMTVAFGTIANQGIQVQPIAVLKVEDIDGNVLEENTTKKKIVISEESAYLMTSMLKDAITVPGGTGGNAYFGRPAAGKTGTTSDWKDAWFCGYTPSKVGVVWMGYDQEKTMSQWKITGGTYPARIWNRMMSKISEGTPVEDFTKPSSIITIQVCNKSGLLPGLYCPPENIINEIAAKGKQPNSLCDYHHEIAPQEGSGTN